jgi:homoserine kinase
MFVDVEVESVSSGEAHAWTAREGHAREWPPVVEDLFFRAFDHVWRELRNEPVGLRARVRSTIPLGRGLGSSGAAVAAGLVAARAISGKALKTQRLVDWGLSLEGHPDNVTASLLGGCTIGVPTARGVCVLRVPVHSSLGFAIAWPAQPLATERSRAVLPREVPFTDAVENARRLPLLLEGLRTGEPELLRQGGRDRLHESYRLPLLPGAAAALAAAREAGAWLATLSGAGSGLVALGPLEAMEDIATAMGGILERDAGPAVAQVVEAVAQGAAGH